MTRTTFQPGQIPVWMALVIPLLTWIPLTTMDPAQAVRETPTFLVDIGLLWVVAAVIGSRSVWLGLFAAWASLGVLTHPTVDAFETALLITLGCLVIVLVKDLTADKVKLAIKMLVAVGVFQSCYSVLNWMGLDLFWALGRVQAPWGALGTLGNSNYVAAYLAMLIPLAAGPVLAILIIGLALTKSVLGVLAATVGLTVKYPQYRMVVFVLACTALAVLLGTRENFFDNAASRAQIWLIAWRDTNWIQALWGHGPGSWMWRIPDLQKQLGFVPGGYFVWAHNEYVQLVYEVGLLGLAALSTFVYQHRQMFATVFGGSLAAILVSAGGMFGFHVAVYAIAAVVIIGLALAEERHAELA